LIEAQLEAVERGVGDVRQNNVEVWPIERRDEREAQRAKPARCRQPHLAVALELRKISAELLYGRVEDEKPETV
jgi:hypothetical protein